MVDTGASLSIVNISSLRGLGATMKSHAVDVQVADNWWAKTAGLIVLHLEIGGITGMFLSPFSIVLRAQNTTQFWIATSWRLLGTWWM